MEEVSLARPDLTKQNVAQRVSRKPLVLLLPSPPAAPSRPLWISTTRPNEKESEVCFHFAARRVAIRRQTDGREIHPLGQRLFAIIFNFCATTTPGMPKTFATPKRSTEKGQTTLDGNERAISAEPDLEHVRFAKYIGTVGYPS